MSMRLLLLTLVLFSTTSIAQETTTKNVQPPLLTNQSITGRYYYANQNFIKDVYITTPINGKFYFRFFMGQTPTYGAMVVQYYNEIDGVATFDKDGIAHFTNPHKNCELRFSFRSIHLLVDQIGSCNMAAEMGMEARGIYNQLEAF